MAVVYGPKGSDNTAYLYDFAKEYVKQAQERAINELYGQAMQALAAYAGENQSPAMEGQPFSYADLQWNDAARILGDPKFSKLGKDAFTILRDVTGKEGLVDASRERRIGDVLRGDLIKGYRGMSDSIMSGDDRKALGYGALANVQAAIPQISFLANQERMNETQPLHEANMKAQTDLYKAQAQAYRNQTATPYGVPRSQERQPTAYEIAQAERSDRENRINAALAGQQVHLTPREAEDLYRQDIRDPRFMGMSWEEWLKRRIPNALVSWEMPNQQAQGMPSDPDYERFKETMMKGIDPAVLQKVLGGR